MRNVDLLLVIVGQAAQVVQFVHVHNQVCKAVHDLGCVTVSQSQFLLEDLNHTVECLIYGVEVHVSARVLIRCELYE